METIYYDQKIRKFRCDILTLYTFSMLLHQSLRKKTSFFPSYTFHCNDKVEFNFITNINIARQALMIQNNHFNSWKQFY